MNTSRLLFTLVCIFLSTNQALSQNPYVHHINQQLRHIFSQITYPDPDIVFLSDRSVKLSDSTFYSNNSPDTLDVPTWYQLYDELYYAAHDTLWMSKHADIESYANRFYHDTIPIMIMDYAYYYLRDSNTINTNAYFNFDTLNNFLYDKPDIHESPFLKDNIFCASPAIASGDYATAVFRIDPTLLFYDHGNALYYNSNRNLKIDFGDGLGWRTVDPLVVNHFPVTYTTAGEHLIQTALFHNNVMLKCSRSGYTTRSEDVLTPPDEQFELGGLDVGVYNSCSEAGGGKVIIYLEGIDLMDIVASSSRGISEIYTEMIQSEYLAELQNFGHTFYVVNWKKSTIDMRFNALYVVNLIEWLKQVYQENDQQFVIIGESMGGVIARYALTFMESKDYQTGFFTPFFQEAVTDPGNALYVATHPNILTIGSQHRQLDLVPLLHKTRELITIDAPHQGANVPLAIQHLYRKGTQLFFPSAAFWSTVFKTGLEAKASRQLLIYHLEGKLVPLANTSAYSSDPSHSAFYGQLSGMGDYPQFCKLMALSSGSFNGANQTHAFNPDASRVPGDRILEFSTNLFGTVLWMYIPLMTGELNLYTNPNGSGTFYNAALGTFTFDLRLRLFGITFNNTYGNLYNDNQAALNVKPYCVSAGGYFNTKYSDSLANPGQRHISWPKNWETSIFSSNYVKTGNGCLRFQTHVGVQGFSSVNFNYALCTDGFEFGFIPVKSAIDYRANVPLHHDILNENIITKLSRTPFDVIMGYPKINSSHLVYRDEIVYNITRLPAANSMWQNTYFTADLNGEDLVKRSLLCMEIGDEELYLENYTLTQPAAFQAQFDIRINERNPYFRYVSQPPVSPEYDAIYSKEKNLTILPFGFATFYVDSASSPTGLGLVYTAPFSPYHTVVQQEMAICTIDYADRTITVTQPDLLEAPLITFFPNPASTTFSYKLYLEGDDVRLTITDLAGKVVVQQQLETPTGSIDIKHLQSGTYIVTVNNGIEKETRRLIVN